MTQFKEGAVSDVLHWQPARTAAPLAAVGGPIGTASLPGGKRSCYLLNAHFVPNNAFAWPNDGLGISNPTSAVAYLDGCDCVLPEDAQDVAQGLLNRPVLLTYGADGIRPRTRLT